MNEEKHFYIFRHGETDWNRAKRCQGHTNIPLNETGRQQATLLAEKFCSSLPEVIYSSDLSRAVQTAREVSSRYNIPLIERAELRESHLGDIEGMTVEEAKMKVGDDVWASFRRLDQHSLSVRFPGGESREEVLTRLRGFIDEMIRQEAYQHIGVSTHGGALRNLLHSYLPNETDPLPIPNCALYKLSYLPHFSWPWKVEGPL